MADIELVIKIPEESYNYWKKHKYEYVLSEAIADGIVLPKGHGNLKDEDEIYELLNSINGTAELDKAFEAVEQATTIIKADEENEDEYRN